MYNSLRFSHLSTDAAKQFFLYKFSDQTLQKQVPVSKYFGTEVERCWYFNFLPYLFAVFFMSIYYECDKNKRSNKRQTIFATSDGNFK